jgi:hypothetical protein
MGVGPDGLIGADEQLSVSFQHDNGTTARVELLYVALARLRGPASLEFDAAAGQAALDGVSLTSAVYRGESAQREAGIVGMRLHGAAPGYGLDAAIVRVLAPGTDGNQINTPPPTPPPTVCFRVLLRLV